MDSKELKKIANVLSIVAKFATLAIPSTVLQLASQEAIDRSKGAVLNLPDGFPKIEDVLAKKAPMVSTAVSDILSTLNITDELITDFSNSTGETSNRLIQQYIQDRRSVDYSESEVAQIRSGLSSYIMQLRLWSVDNNDLLMDHLRKIDSDLLNLTSQMKQIKTVQESHTNEIKQIKKNMDSTQKQTTPDILLEDQREKINDQFYNYFIADSTYSIKSFFLFDNYERVVLSEQSPKLDKKKFSQDQLETPLQFDEIKEIITDQKILLITGLYGTGKTALLKKLCMEFEKDEGIITRFFQTSSVIDFIDTALTEEKIQPDINTIKHMALNKLEMKFLSYACNDKPVFIFIDELDEMNIALRDNKSYLSLFISWLCTFQASNPSFTFILASRKFTQIGDRDSLCVADALFEEYYINNNGKPLNVIQTRNFSTTARDKWIEEFAEKKKKEITYSEIKKTYGKIAGALVNPIFLFAFMRRFIEEYPSHEMKGYYYYYSSFIEETISGRYGLGQNAKFTESETFQTREDYYKILREIAFSILSAQEKVITTEIYKESIEEEQPVLADALTSRKFEIQLSQLSKLMPKTDYEKASLINCYFFNMDSRRVYFTDTNILFSLAAEHIFDSVQQQAEEKLEFGMSDLENIKLVQLYPQLADYVIYLTICSKSSDLIIAYLNSFVTDNSIRSHYMDLSNKTMHRVERIILLYILFLKTYTSSYKTYPHIFKEILYYVNAYRTNIILSGPIERTYTIERYFMNINLHDIVLKRANLKYFNFQGSKITGQCKFIQCNFFDTNINNVIMGGTNFLLCEINNVKKLDIKRATGDNNPQAIFDTCRISNSHFSANSLIFRNCIISALEIYLDGERYIEFDHCIIYALKINYCNNTRKWPKFFDCVYDNTPIITPYSKDEINKKLGLNS